MSFYCHAILKSNSWQNYVFRICRSNLNNEREKHNVCCRFNFWCYETHGIICQCTFIAMSFLLFFFVESLYFYPKLFSFIRKVSNFYLKGEKRKHNNNHLPYFPFIRRHFQCGQCLRGHLSVTHNYIVIYQLLSCIMISVDFCQNINHCLV